MAESENKERIKELEKESELKYKNSLNNVDADTKVLIPKFEWGEKIKDGERITIQKIITDSFIIPKTLKKELLTNIDIAMNEGLIPPYIIIIPQSKVKKRKIKDLTFPTPFLDHKLYFTEGIKKIKIFEVN